MANIDFNDQWSVLKAFFQSASAANVAALSPRPTVYRDDEEQMEDMLPVIAIGLSGSSQDRDKAGGANRHQQFGTRFHLYLAAKGPNVATTNTSCLAIVSAIANDLAGAGAFVGTDRTKLYSAVMDSWDWDPATHDSLVAQAFLDITAIFFRV